jgi:excisionase family DNA binding protein
MRSTKKLNSESSTLQPSFQPRLLRIKEAATYLGATIWFVRSLAWNSAVPHLVFGKRILFDLADLDAWIEKQKKEARAA